MIELATMTGTKVPIREADVKEFRARVRGGVFQPGDEGYEAARKIWNGMTDRRPGMVVRCSGTADVIATVNFARERGLLVSVRGGGHNVAGRAVVDGGVVINLSGMRSVRVDPRKKVVRVEGGATLGDIDHETQAFGLAVPLGLVTRTGVAGLALHGGLGALTRKHGLTADNLVAADVVTADGRLVVADERSHSDLLWALKGGGGNFGVVTLFEFSLHPVGPEVWVAIVLYPITKAVKVLRFYRDFMSRAPDDIMALALLWSTPTEEPIPHEHRGVPTAVLAAWHSGPFDEGERAIQPLREVDKPIADLSGPMPFTTAQSLFDRDYPDGRRYYWKSLYLKHLDDDVINALVKHAERRPSPISSLDVWALGGAMGRVKPADTAFAERSAPFGVGIEANWDDPSADSANVRWARTVFRDMERFSTGGTYLNFPGFAEKGEELLRKSYGLNYARLQSIKAKYDPENFFRSNLNISPKA